MPAAEEVARPVEPEDAEQPQVNGVLVTKTREDEGINIDVQVLGTVEATEAPVLLELAVRTVRTQLGLTT